MAYDTKCYDLAAAFLDDEPHLKPKIGSLAQTIQNAIEDWIEYENKQEANMNAAKASDQIDALSR